MSDVVVVGYGTQKKANLTGAVSTVNMDNILTDRLVTSTAQALQGAAPGLQITTGSGQPGASSSINIRGFTSINGGSPLVLVDNVPMNMDDVNPEDIATVTVLKDREPLIVSWPGKIKAGSKSDLITATWDFVPTACEAINIKTPKNIDGIIILPTLLGRQQLEKHPFLYWEFPQYGGQQAVRMGKWKGIRFDMLKGNMKIKLFDLENDLQEQHDVAAEHPDVVKNIEKIMKKEHKTPLVEDFRMKVLDNQ